MVKIKVMKGEIHMSALKLSIDGDANPGSKGKPYKLTFNNYVLAGNESSLQNDISAIYCFYSMDNSTTNDTKYKLLYIGKSKNLKARLLQHAIKPKDFPANQKTVTKEQLGDFLCDPDDITRKCFYAYATLDGRSLEKCEAAMIKQFQPRLNSKAKETIGCHDESYFMIEGKYFYSPLQRGIVYHVGND